MRSDDGGGILDISIHGIDSFVRECGNYFAELLACRSTARRYRSFICRTVYSLPAFRMTAGIRGSVIGLPFVPSVQLLRPCGRFARNHYTKAYPKRDALGLARCVARQTPLVRSSCNAVSMPSIEP